jgi:general secretion pathway protein D
LTTSIPRFLAAIGLTTMALAAALAAPAVHAADDMVTLNFVNADIDSVVKAVSEMTGRNFILDPKVKGVVNIVSARPVARSLVYPTLLSALRLQGFTAIESDGITKIVPEADAKQQGSAVVMSGKAGGVGQGGDRLVTEVFALKYESAVQLVNVLRPLITPNNAIAAVPTGNALVITDYAENLKRIEKIVASLDVPPAGEAILVPIRYASALDLVQIMGRLLVDAPGSAGAAPDTQQRVTLVADTRSNSVLVRGENSSRVARARALIEQLDTPGRVGGNIFIIYLRNADAVRVARTLRALFSGGSDTTGDSTPLATLPGLGTPITAGTSSAGNGSPASAASPLAGSPTSSAPGFTAGGATIQADTANNALLVMAPEPIYNNIRAIVEKLDVRRAQIYVEALVVEVTADKAAEFGIQWNLLDPNRLSNNQTQVGGGTNFGTRGSGTNLLDASLGLTTVGQGLNIAVIRGSINIGGLAITNIALLARALESDANTNILSTPNLLTLDNEEAKIVVGQNVPFITGQYAVTGSATTPTPFQTIERKDVGLTLRVKPQITEGGTVRMTIYEEVSRIQDTTNAAGIITSKRSLESTVAVDDGQIIVLGGLIEDSFTDGSSRVPVLGDVPGLGALFRYDNRHRIKTNLMVFLKPTVIRTAAAGATLTNDRYDYLMGEQQRLKPAERAFWPDETVPQLPLLPSTPLNAPPAGLPSSPAPAPVLSPKPQ